MRVAELITNWRFIKKYSLRDAAEEMGLSSSSLARIEKGKVPDGETLIKLVNWLFGTEEMNGKESSVATRETDSFKEENNIEVETSDQT